MMAMILKNHDKEPFLLLLLILFLSACITERMVIQSRVPTIPLYPIDPAPSKLLLLNIHNVPALDYRDKKEDLFISLLDTVLFEISKEVRNRSAINLEIIYGLTKAEKRDSSIKELMDQHHASHAIVITFFNIYFEQTKVEVTKDSTGTHREAFYDIVCDINYSLYDKKGVFKDLSMTERYFHSSRLVVSGLLAVGPGVVSKRNDALEIVRVNLVDYLNNFFPGWEGRARTIFVGKELGTVREAIAREDYKAALEESLHFVTNSDKRLAAEANYNCAVFFERNDRAQDAKAYLEKSLAIYALSEADSMMSDYGF
jgi:hypothetical protein